MATKASKNKVASRIVKLGEVGVDSGQLVLCDPCYIESEFKQETTNATCSNHEIYKHKKTGKLYQFCYHNMPSMNMKPSRPDIIPFPGSYADVIAELKKCPNDLIESGDFVKTDIDPSAHIPNGEFSYEGISKVTRKSKDHGGQLNFKLGHAGAAVAFCSGLGDGLYEVFAEIVNAGQWGERVKKVWVELITDEDLKEMQKEK